MSGVHSQLRDGVLVVTLDNPPVNSLNLELRRAILAELARAQAEEPVRAAVLIGAGGVFCGGADIRALNTPVYWSYPRTIELGAVLDGMTKPVVAAIDGSALGGGLELALACHWRIAKPDARLALPEIKLGLLPGGGGTIRLPRLIGADAAAEMMLSGEPVDGRRARELGFVDAVAEGDLLEAALRFAHEVLERREPLRRALDLQERVAGLDVRSWIADQYRRLEERGAHGVAERVILQCIEAGIAQPAEEAVKASDAATRKLMESSESKALRYLFFAERQAAKIGQAQAAQPPRIERVGLVGGGALAARLDAMLRDAGVSVAAEGAQFLIATRMGSEDEARLSSLHESLAADVPFAVAGGYDDWSRLRALAPGRAVLGLCFGPGRVVELVREPEEEGSGMNAVARLLRRLGKVCVACAPSPGFIVERLQGALERQKRLLAERGLDRGEVDDAYRDFVLMPGALRESQTEIIRLCAAAMAEQGQQLLDAGIAVRASDIDVALVAGGIYPASRGGPMFSASEALFS
jgi:enoyl-CoA hydratase/carnithine racemase